MFVQQHRRVDVCGQSKYARSNPMVLPGEWVLHTYSSEPRRLCGRGSHGTGSLFWQHLTVPILKVQVLSNTILLTWTVATVLFGSCQKNMHPVSMHTLDFFVVECHLQWLFVVAQKMWWFTSESVFLPEIFRAKVLFLWNPWSALPHPRLSKWPGLVNAACDDKILRF